MFAPALQRNFLRVARMQSHVWRRDTVVKDLTHSVSHIRRQESWLPEFCACGCGYIVFCALLGGSYINISTTNHINYRASAPARIVSVSSAAESRVGSLMSLSEHLGLAVPLGLFIRESWSRRDLSH